MHKLQLLFKRMATQITHNIPHIMFDLPLAGEIKCSAGKPVSFSVEASTRGCAVPRVLGTSH